MLKKLEVYHIIAFLVLFCMLVLKVCMFHYWCYGSVFGFNSLREMPNEVIAFYLPKVAVGLLLSSFVFLTRREWWTIIVSGIVDVWCLANLTYFRANNLFLSLDAIRMADNLQGFGASIGQYTNMSSWSFFILTMVYAVILTILYYSLFRKAERYKYQWVGFAVVVGVSVICSMVGGWCTFKVYHQEDEAEFDAAYLNPFIMPKEISSERWQKDRQQLNYVYNHSIITYAVYMLHEGHELDKQRQSEVVFEEGEIAQIDRAINHYASDSIMPKCNLIIVMVESLESWLIEMTDINDERILPNIMGLMERHPTLYCHNVKSQVKHGVSGDGQMMCNTGLMPIQSGAACMLYGYNTYPNYAHLYPQSTLYNPSLNAWNQNVMTKRYGYKNQRQPEDVRKSGMIIAGANWWDEHLFQNVVEDLDKRDTADLFCDFLITISSHSPFNMYDFGFKKEMKEHWSENAKLYMGAERYMDHYLGLLIDYMEEKKMFDNTLLVITGDHTVYKQTTIEEYLIEGAREAGISVKNGQNYVPLIMVGYGIEENKTIEEVVYQMDIYPTILHCIGAGEYFWQGFGKDLLTETAQRRFTEEEAYMLSDKMIRANWFKDSPELERKSPERVFESVEHRYIAHAGGMIDGIYYTNSKEAVENAISKGMKYIELDLALTSDGEVVCLHDWENYNRVAIGVAADSALSWKDFMQTRLYGKYTPLSSYDILKIWGEHKDLWLVTDKISDPEIINRAFGEIRERVIVECFSYEDYKTLREQGYRVFMSQLPPSEKGEVLHNGATADDSYVFSRSYDVRKGCFKECAIYSCKNRQEADSVLAMDERIRFVYIDEVE